MIPTTVPLARHLTLLVGFLLLVCSSFASPCPSVLAAETLVPSMCSVSTPHLGGQGPEVRGRTHGHGTLWALLFYRPPAIAGTDLKIVLRETGSGPLHTAAHGPNGETVMPQWTERHGSSNWNRPGDEWGTGWRLTTAGCWHLHAWRKTASGNVWLTVRPST